MPNALTKGLDRVVDWLAPPPAAFAPQQGWTPPPLSTAAAAAAAPTAFASVQVPTVAENGQALNLRPPFPRPFQDKAWSYYRHCGEARQAVDWLASAISRCHLYIGDLPDGAGDPTPVTDPGVAGEVLEELHDGPIGQSAMLHRLAVHLLVPGETWLAGYPSAEPAGAPADGGAGGEERTRWSVLSRKEWQQSSEQVVRLRLPEHPKRGTDGWVTLPAEQVALVPIYNPDPEDASTATSAFEAALGTLDELDGLSRRVGADIQSRLVGNGAFPIPESATMATPTEGEGANLQQDPFVTAFFRSAKKAIENPDDPSACLPLVFRVADESLANMKLIEFATKFDAQIPVLRQDARRTLAADLDIPSSVVMGVEDLNHWCTLPDVEIMTASGWKTHDQLSTGEPVLTLNHQTGLSEWQPLQAVNTWQVTDEPMIAMTGRRHSSVTTAAHRWPVLHGRNRDHRTWATSAELATRSANPDQQCYDYIALAAPHAELPTHAKYDDALVELVAWLFTEGQVVTRPGRCAPTVTLYQSHQANPDNVARIRRALTALFGPESPTLDKGGRYSTPESQQRRPWARAMREQGSTVSAIAAELGVSVTMAYRYLALDGRVADTVPRWRTHRTSNGMTRFRVNTAAAMVLTEHAPNRVVTTEFVRHLTAAQLELFIDTAIRGDGHYLHGQTPIIGQKDPAMLDAVELAAILTGRSTYRYTHTSDGRSAAGPWPKTQHVLAISQRTGFAPRGRNLSEQTHTGTIWCPTTRNGTWLARHEGTVFYTGNSAWAVQDDAVRAHIGPLISQICTALTIKILWPALRAAGEADPETKCVWWDASAITQRPDRSEVVLSAATAKPAIIGGKAARRELGFDETDAPTPEEIEAAKPPPPPGGAGGDGQGKDGGQEDPSKQPNPPASPGGDPGEDSETPPNKHAA